MSARAVGLALWLALGGLAALALFWQIRHPPQPPVVRAAPPPEPPAAPPLEPFRLAPPGHYNPITARPLFIADRRPEPPPPEDAAAPEKPLPGPEQKFMLFGVMIAPGTQAALVRLEEPNAKTVRVKVGEMVGEWRLDKVSADGVVLRKGDEMRELPLSRPRKPAKPRGGRMGAGPQNAAGPANPSPPPVSPPAPPPVSPPIGPVGMPATPEMTQ